MIRVIIISVPDNSEDDCDVIEDEQQGNTNDDHAHLQIVLRWSQLSISPPLLFLLHHLCQLRVADCTSTDTIPVPPITGSPAIMLINSYLKPSKATMSSFLPCRLLQCPTLLSQPSPVVVQLLQDPSLQIARCTV